jgi:mannose-1-phosphate guanylyltransferase
MPKRALLLAAGLGKRLRPLTDHIPKCLAPIRGRPLLEFWLDMLDRARFDEVLINTHYFADLVEEYVEHSAYRKFATLSFEPDLLGTAGTMLRHKHFFVDGPVLVAHADNLTSFDPADLMRRHESRPAECAMTMMTFDTDDPRSCGIVELDERSVVRAFHEKSASAPGTIANAAVYVVEPEIVGFIESLGREFADLSTEVIPHFMGRIFASHHPGLHRDIGTLQSLKAAQAEFRGAMPAVMSPDPWRRLLERNDGRLARQIAAALPEALIS